MSTHERTKMVGEESRGKNDDIIKMFRCFLSRGPRIAHKRNCPSKINRKTLKNLWRRRRKIFDAVHEKNAFCFRCFQAKRIKGNFYESE